MTDPLAVPLLTADLPGVGGSIKCAPEEFDVEEIPAYEPGGSGDHLFLWIQKRSMGAQYFARQVARRLDVPPGEVGVAGLKDRHAVTRQWVSVPAIAEPRLGQLAGDGIELLKTSRHTNKLRSGHLRGNRFSVLVRAADRTRSSELDAVVQRIRTMGMPNFYGPQRFGRDGETSSLGMAMLRGEPPARRLNPFLKKLAISAAQSLLFNQYLSHRMNDGLFRQVLPGDVMAKWPAGGMFTVVDQPREQQRFDAREIVHAGPIFGRKTFPTAGEAAEREAAVMRDAGLSRESFVPLGKLAMGTRRHNLVYLDDLNAAWETGGLRLEFTLPAGSYATVLLREVMKCDVKDDEDVDAE